MNRMKTRLRKVKFSYQTNFSCLFTILKISFPPYRNEDHCGNCINWHVKALQLVNLSQGTEVVEVGKWEPLQGMVHMDDLFPHIMGGLRGRTLRVASYDVSFIFTSRKKYFIFSVSQVLREIKVSKCSVSNVAIFHIERLSIVIIMIFCTFWRLKFAKSTIKASEMAKTKLSELLNFPNWFHVKSECQRNPAISTICVYSFPLGKTSPWIAEAKSCKLQESLLPFWTN